MYIEKFCRLTDDFLSCIQTFCHFNIPYSGRLFIVKAVSRPIGLKDTHLILKKKSISFPVKRHYYKDYFLYPILGEIKQCFGFDIRIKK